jgi:hypothetical protein
MPAPPPPPNDPALAIEDAAGTPAADLPAEPAPPRPLTSANHSSRAHPPGEEPNRLPEATHIWLNEPADRLFGIRRVGVEGNPAAHFSWMTGLLPYLDHQAVYDRIDFSQPVTSSANLRAGMNVIPEFINPHEERQTWKGFPLDGLALTHFAGMSGVEDSRNVVAAKLPRSDPRAGVFGYDEVARAGDITDGTSQTILIVGSGAMANPWIMGGGGTIRGAREPLFDKVTGLGMKGLAGGGTLAVMADGSVRHVSPSIDPKVFKAMCTIHGAESVDLDRSAPTIPREHWKAAPRKAPPASGSR